MDGEPDHEQAMAEALIRWRRWPSVSPPMPAKDASLLVRRLDLSTVTRLMRSPDELDVDRRAKMLLERLEVLAAQKSMGGKRGGPFPPEFSAN